MEEKQVQTVKWVVLGVFVFLAICTVSFAYFAFKAYSLAQSLSSDHAMLQATVAQTQANTSDIKTIVDFINKSIQASQIAATSTKK